MLIKSLTLNGKFALFFIFLGNDGNVSGINNSLDEALENVLNVRPKPTNTNSVQMSSLVPSSSFPQTGIV